jgi:hypothetical protein
MPSTPISASFFMFSQGKLPSMYFLAFALNSPWARSRTVATIRRCCSVNWKSIACAPGRSPARAQTGALPCPRAYRRVSGKSIRADTGAGPDIRWGRRDHVAYSITLSAIASIASGISIPSCLAVRRSMLKSNLVGCWTRSKSFSVLTSKLRTTIPVLSQRRCTGTIPLSRGLPSIVQQRLKNL